jgi:hypothetical protein
MMGDGTEPFAMEDADWQFFYEAASREIDADIDAALIRVSRGESTLADAVLLAGYLNRGQLFDKHTERCPTHYETEDAE